jgi:hypothetical protein
MTAMARPDSGTSGPWSDGMNEHDQLRALVIENKRQKECIEAALEIAENLLMEAPNYDYERRLVSADDILRIVQELNSSLRNDSDQ